MNVLEVCHGKAMLCLIWQAVMTRIPIASRMGESSLRCVRSLWLTMSSRSEENIRLETQHRAITSLIGDKTFHAPVASPSRILDIGCGSGIATLELAKRFPSAQVVGVDLAPVIELSYLPSNVLFMQGTFIDLVKDGKLQENDFDYVFQRMLVMGVVDWTKHISTAVRLLKPGGWLELQDLSWHVYDQNGQLIDHRYSHILAIQKASLEKGLDPFCGEHLAKCIRNAGLRQISSEKFPFAWTYWSERPETELIAAHQQSAAHSEVRNALLEKLLGSTGTYSQHAIEEFKQETAVSYDQADEGVHFVYGVALGQKTIC